MGLWYLVAVTRLDNGVVVSCSSTRLDNVVVASCSGTRLDNGVVVSFRPVLEPTSLHGSRRVTAFCDACMLHVHDTLSG